MYICICLQNVYDFLPYLNIIPLYLRVKLSIITSMSQQIVLLIIKWLFLLLPFMAMQAYVMTCET